MSQKRALVVDDSKSARAFLTRILERHELRVDAAGSAEEAISYLNENQPDVIFMDHLMPGMDGFQALQAIKNNPGTATIPVMMYTSQEGELYLSQARALGAIGVLPKQIRPADVSKALEQLRLVSDPKAAATDELPAVIPTIGPLDENPPDAEGAVTGASVAALRAHVDAALREQSARLRRFVTEQLDQHAERVVGDLRAMAQVAAGNPPAPVPVVIPPRRLGWGMLAAAVLGAAAVAVLAFFWMQAVDAQKQLAGQLQQAQGQLGALQKQLAAKEAAAPAADAGEAAADADLLVLPVGYGEVPLGGARLEPVQSLLARLNAQGFKGVVQLRYVPGRFCQSGSGEAATQAAAELAYARCEQMGNPVAETASVSQRESVAFANMVAAARKSAGEAIDVQIATGSPDESLRSYPAVSDGLTAGEWNRIAAANNRVEVRWHAAGQ